MDDAQSFESRLDSVRKELRDLIDRFIQDEAVSLEEWLSKVAINSDNDCWKRRACRMKSCPAYKKRNCKCWLVAGTMCGGEVQGVFAKKYRSCMECKVYQDIVFASSITEIEEHLIILVHTLINKQEQINALATIDHLTGLHNRRYFDLLIESKINSMERTGGLIYLTLIDVDNFKKINDIYGHTVGDDILKICAGILLDSVRKADIVVRYGGDEFLIAASSSSPDLNTSEIIAQRIADKLRVWNKKNAPAGIKLSLSIGHSVLQKGGGLDTCIHEADQRMYENKRGKAVIHKREKVKKTR